MLERLDEPLVPGGVAPEAVEDGAALVLQLGEFLLGLFLLPAVGAEGGFGLGALRGGFSRRRGRW